MCYHSQLLHRKRHLPATTLNCTICHREYDAGYHLTCDNCGSANGILDIQYDYDFAEKYMTREVLASRPQDHWRWGANPRDTR